MTTSQRLKLATIAALQESTPSATITIVDAKLRDAIELPVIAVEVMNTAAHSQALQHVEMVTIAATLRVHSGDNDQDVDEWIDQIESTFGDSSFMKSSASDDMKTYSWIYQGSTQSWDENILEVSFTAEVLCSRFDLQPQN